MISCMIVPILLLQPVAEDAEPPATPFSVFLRGSGSADLREGLSTLRGDTLVLFPGVFHEDGMFTLQALGAVEHPQDSGNVAFRTISAGGFCRWPGSPWISLGVFRGLADPFIPGLDAPVTEWKSTGVQDENGASVQMGGVLGFDSFWNQYGDTLSYYGVDSPWLGFGMVSWSSLKTDSSEMQTVGGFIDLRTLQPWFSITGTDDVWNGAVEVRGWKPFRTPDVSLEVVPEGAWSENGSFVGINGFLSGRTRAFSGYFKAYAETDSLAEMTVEAGLDLLSEAGLRWSLAAEMLRLDDFNGDVSCWYRNSPAGCGGSLSACEDSLCFTASALYCPVRGVNSLLSVSTDLNASSPDPRCSFRVFGAGENGTAHVSVEWKEGTTELSLGVSAWID